MHPKWNNLTFALRVLLSLALLLAPFSSHATAPEGKGDGSGGGRAFDLSLIALKAEERLLHLEFSKNVTNITVRDTNAALIRVEREDGSSLPATVEIPDDQLEREKRRSVSVHLLEPLEAGKTYRLLVQSGFMAKNGETTPEDMSRDFTLGTDIRMEEQTATGPLSGEQKEMNGQGFLHSNTGRLLLGILLVSFALMIFIQNKRRKA